MKPGPAKRSYMREWRKRHVERLRAVDRARYPAEAERRRAAAKRYYHGDLSAGRAKRAAWRVAHPGRGTEDKRAWRERNPERARAENREIQARRRARLRGNATEKIDPQIVWERDEGACGICGEAADFADWHLDHVYPIALGGGHLYSNVQVAHPPRNRKKGARVPDIS